MILKYVEDKNTSECYPTPKNIIDKMLDKLDMKEIKYILEPSAGKGDIVREIIRRIHNSSHNINIDTIELDSNLRAILKHNFSQEMIDELNKKWNIISENKDVLNHWSSGQYRYYENGEYHNFSDDIQKKLKDIKYELSGIDSKSVKVVHDDFLTYTDYKKYDAIIMNPPFSNGDAHLLKAIKLQERGGQIVCLLNAETLRNPYTQRRKDLMALLDKYEADIEYIQGGFSDAERKTDIDIALIYINIKRAVNDGKASIFEKMAKAKKYSAPTKEESLELEVSDFIKAIVNRYQIEVESGLELINTYIRMKPYLDSSIKSDVYSNKLLLLTDGNGRYQVQPNDYVRSVRYKYWSGLLSNDKFVGKLTSKLQTFYRDKISEYAEYEFSEFNINALLTEMNANIKTGIEDEVDKMYNRLTEEHAYYPECTKNRHLYNGWKTNKAWKLTNKSILPCYGVFSSWDGKPRTYEAFNVLSDIEKVFNYFDGNMTAEVNLQYTIESSFSNGITKNIPCKYFNVTFYKKGTVHITFTCPELIDRYNIYSAQNRGWLPPSYGKKTYNAMTEEEKSVIDEFQGEKAYNKVLARKEYYLASPTETSEMIMLTA